MGAGERDEGQPGQNGTLGRKRPEPGLYPTRRMVPRSVA